ncbi:hypothetical protein CEK25_002885 [Fusarium fujikuroi]|nr:hypothetical protein CEK25_002885 [Fusarium fujikuroi]
MTPRHSTEMPDSTGRNGTFNRARAHTRSPSPLMDEQHHDHGRARPTRTSQRRRQRIATGISSAADSFATVPSRVPTINEEDPSNWLPAFLQTKLLTGVCRNGYRVAFMHLSVYCTGGGRRSQETLADRVQESLSVYEHRESALQLQKTVADIIQAPLRIGEHLIVLGRPGSGCKKEPKRILHQFDGLLRGGETLITFNGSAWLGMLTLLKTMTGYDKEFPQGETGYNQEVAAASHLPFDPNNLGLAETG